MLTFDDGPWPVNTPSVLKTLAEECTKEIFFPIGKHATYYPEILKHVAAEGHTIGSHTWSHANLNNKKLTDDQRKEEIEKGFQRGEVGARRGTLAAVPASPRSSIRPRWWTYLGERNISIWSCDLDSFDSRPARRRRSSTP